MTYRLSWVLALMLAPALGFFIIFALGPMIAAGYISLLKWDGLNPSVWVGLANWRKLFSDAVTGHAIVLTIEMMVISWLIQTPISLLLGIFIAGRQRYREVLSVFYFLPLLFSTVAIGLTWDYLLNPNFGLLNALLQKAGLSGLAKNWLGDPNLAFTTMMFLLAWQYIPFHSLLYQAGTRQIPEVFYDAAKIDGAGRLSQFFNITLPQLRYTIVTSTILILTGSLTTFDLIFVTTGGGPGYATRILPLHMYLTAFPGTQFGYGSALAVLLALSGITLSVVLLKLTGFSRMESQMEGM